MVTFHLLVLELENGNTSEVELKVGKSMLLKLEIAEFTITLGNPDNALSSTPLPIKSILKNSLFEDVDFY